MNQVFTILKHVGGALLRRLRGVGGADGRNITIIVYSMGKVGSTSVYHSLRRCLRPVDIFHTHFLSDHWLKQELPTLNKHFHHNIEIGNRIRDHIKKTPAKRLKIVTLVREPIGRDISGIFQNLPAHFHGLDPSFEEVVRVLERHEHSYTLNWFDTEFRNFLGFDIYALPFDKTKGYSIYRTESADILCIRLEDLNRVFSIAFEEFLGITGLELVAKNISATKDTSELYKKVLALYKPSAEKLSFVYSSKYVRHFYSDMEIEQFQHKWK